MPAEVWSRWGKEDEIGAPNLIRPEVISGALSHVRQGRVLSLAQRIGPGIPVPAHRHRPMHVMNRDGGDYAAGAKRPNGFQFAEDTLIMPLHLGTHIDALCHAWYDDRLYNGFEGRTIRSTTGAQRCGIDKLPPIVTRGLLLDMVRLTGAPLAPGTAIREGDLVAAAAQAGVSIEPGDAVLVRTGWLETTGSGPVVSFDSEPGLDVEAGLWLAEAGASIVGADNFAIEVIPFERGETFPVHQRLMRDYGVPLLEGLVLEPLSRAASGPFLFIAAPLPIAGGTASPVNPLVVL